MNDKFLNIIRTAGKIFAWILGGFIGLVIMVLILINFPFVQNVILDRVEKELSKMTGTCISVERMDIYLPAVSLTGIYVEGPADDTLFYAGAIKVAANLTPLLEKTISIENVLVSNLVANISRPGHSEDYNFQFILDSLASGKSLPRQEKSPWDFRIDEINLNDIRLVYDDHYMNRYGVVSLGSFNLDMDIFDINNMEFFAEGMSLENTVVKYSQSAPPDSAIAVATTATTGSDTTSQPVSSPGPGINLKVEELILTENLIVFTDSSTGDHLEFDMGNFRVRNGGMNMNDKAVDIGVVSLSGSRVLYRKDSSARDAAPPKVDEPAGNLEETAGSAAAGDPSKTVTGPGSGTTATWQITLDELSLENNHLGYHNERFPQAEEGLDLNHLDIELLNTSITEIRFDSSLQADIRKVVIREQEGLSVRNLEGGVFYSAEKIEVDDFNMETSGTSLNAGMIRLMDYTDINTMDAEGGLDGILYTGDITYLLPSMKEYLPGDRNIDLDISFVKMGNKVNLRNFDLSTEGMSLALEGSLEGLMNLDDMQTEGISLKLETSEAGLRSLLPGPFLPDSFTIPSDLSLAVDITGSMDELAGTLNLNSSLGGFDLRIEQDSIPSGGFSMESRLNLNRLRIGQILNNPQLGIADLDISAMGRGRELMQAEWDLEGMINRFDYSGYAYEDILMEVTYDNPDLSLAVSVDQPAIAFNLEGNAVLRDSFPWVEIRLDLEKIDFDSLNLWTQDVIATADIRADLDSIQAGKLNGSIGIRNVAFLKHGEVYEIDSLIVASIDQADNVELTIDSDLLNLDLQGNIPIMKIPTVVTGLMNQIVTGKRDTIPAGPAYHFDFNLELYRNELLAEVFLPALERLDVQEFNGEMDESGDLIRLNVEIPVVEYGGFTVNSLSTHIDSETGRINGQVHIGEFQLGGLAITDISLGATTFEEKVLVNFNIPKGDTAFMHVVSKIFREEEALVVHVVKDSLVLNGKSWTVNPENRLYLGTPLRAEHFELAYQDQSIRIAGGQAQDGNSVTVIDINDFNLAALGHIFNTEKPLIGGRLDAELTMRPDAAFPSGNLGIDSLDYRGIRLGNISAGSENLPSGIDFDFELASDTGSLTLEGYYLPEKNNSLDLIAGFEKFPLQTAGSLLNSRLETLEGELNGQLSISGTTATPAVSGQLVLNDVRVLPVMLNTWLYIDHETIQFEEHDIRFNNFTLRDAEEREAVLNGSVNTENFRDIELDLSFETEDFQVLNSEEAVEGMPVFGTVSIGADLRINGSPAQLEVQGGVGLKEESELNLVIPGSNAAVIQRDRIVNFIDMDREVEEDRFQVAIEQEAGDASVQMVEGMDISLNISIEENSRLKVIIDQQTGENLSVQGQGDLSFRLQPTGDMNLSGRYNITEGRYFLNFQGLVKREFNILDESYIEWTGQVMEANLNITARYTVETQPPVGEITDPLPFNVVIDIGGEIMSPELNFSISMPEDTRQQYQQVAGYINDINGTESELNKQVMSLVLFKRFMTGQDAGGGGIDVAGTARASISKFLTQQLNRLGSGIEGFNVTFNLDSYESQSGDDARGVTNLEVGVSQSLFSDRLTVRVSGDVYLEGGEQQQADMLNYLDDVSLEYELTEDGVYQLVGFRENDYDGISQGEIIRTGVGIIFSKDYDNFSELFRRDAEKRKEGDE